MALAVRAFHDRGGFLPAPKPNSQLLSTEDGVGVVSIEGPILRKPDLFARVLMGATDSGEIGAALREAGERDDIKAVFLDIDSPGGTVLGTPELAASVASAQRTQAGLCLHLGPDVLGGILDRQPGTRRLCHPLRTGGKHRRGAGGVG